MWSEFRKCQVLADLAAASGKAFSALPPEELRVAVLQAVAWLHRYSYQRFEPEPKRELMLSRSLAEVEALLIPLA